jgi:hypothetical protein
MHLSTSSYAEHHPGYGHGEAADALPINDSCGHAQSPMVQKFGACMTAKQVAAELGYSLVYFTKKIGSEKHGHLEWVKALRPARVKAGSTFEYKTVAVETLMRGRGLL